MNIDFSDLGYISPTHTPFFFLFPEGFFFNLRTSVRPRPGFGISNRNEDQVSVSVSVPKLLLPKPKLPLYYYSGHCDMNPGNTG